jgi:hypothetical protein
MVDIEKVRAELKLVEAFLAKRYHYEHPIKGHLAAALEYLGEEQQGAPPESEVVDFPSIAVSEPTETDATETGGAPVTSEAEATGEPWSTEPDAPAPRRRKRG